MNAVVSLYSLSISRLIIVDDSIGFSCGDDFGSLVELKGELGRKHRWINGVGEGYQSKNDQYFHLYLIYVIPNHQKFNLSDKARIAS